MKFFSLVSIAAAGPNPIRRVVTLLQDMQKKVEKQGEVEEEMFEKYMCYCKTTEGSLNESIESSTTRVSQLTSEVKQGSASKEQLTGELNDHQKDRDEAKTALAKATKIREEEKEQNNADIADFKTNIAALGKAIPALEQGGAGSFLQGPMRKIIAIKTYLTEADKHLLSNFLQGKTQNSSEILGIMKQMKEEMEKDLEELADVETKSQNTYEELVAAKEREIAAASKAVEEKTARKGEVAVELANDKCDLEDTSNSLVEDQKFVSELKKTCDQKSHDWELIQKTRLQELQAIAETIKLLNSDDALDLFKKTLPPAPQTFTPAAQAAPSFVQMKTKSKVRALLRTQQDSRMSSLLRALTGKVNFNKVIKMIDELGAVLAAEQKQDEEHKEYCEAELDKYGDRKKTLQRDVKDMNAAIADDKESIQSLGEQIKELHASIVSLDKSVSEATEQRKEENAEFTNLMAGNNAAIQLIEVAKNRMNQFYNPELATTTAAPQLSEEERIFQASGGDLGPTAAPGGIGGTGIVAPVLAQVRPAPPPPAPGGYKKNKASTGVIGMMDNLIQDLEIEITEAQTAEKDAQADYEQLMSDSKEKRELASTTITDREAAKATLEETMQAKKKQRKETKQTLLNTSETIHNLHTECDFILESFDARREARSTEREALKTAKAVLSGADGRGFSFAQINRHT